MATAAPFAPTAAQRRLLDFIHEHPGYQPTRDLCRSARVPRATYYRWCRNPAFRQWFGSAWASRLVFDGVALLNLARAQAPDKFSYWKALFELTFDPKGLGLLAKWSASLAALAPDAFYPGPDPQSPANSVPVSRWPSEEEWNQRVQALGETLSLPSAPPAATPPSRPNPLRCSAAHTPSTNPVRTAKLLARVLAKLRSAASRPAFPTPRPLALAFASPKRTPQVALPHGA
ncbi:MAG: hypothetical protein ACRD04_14105 [Terriglobales bacterium]